MNAIPNTLFQPSCTLQRQARSASVIVAPAATAPAAADEADPHAITPPAGQADVVHFGHTCLTRRFEAWLHGSRVLDAPLPARYLDHPEHQAEAVACQRRAVREDSYVPARTPLLFL